MPESIFIQVGQCGNQVGFNFWEAVLREYERNKDIIELCEVNQLFRIIDNSHTANARFFDCLKARAILIDMEETVIHEGRRGFAYNLFSNNQVLTDVSGSGNNWAAGYEFGEKYKEHVLELYRRQAESCSHLDSFIMIFSLGGGTGSGFGSAALQFLKDEYPHVPRIVFAVFPSLIDDVVVSPYNALLANGYLIDHASCVVPFHNQVLNRICMRSAKKNALRSCTSTYQQESYRPFEDMNYLIRNTMLDITSSARFHGNSNVDICDIMTNLVIYPKLKYLVPALAPLLSKEEIRTENLFKDLYSGNNQLTDASMKKGKLLGTLIHTRGPTNDIGLNSNVFDLQDNFDFLNYRQNVRIGHSFARPEGRKRSVLQLGNSTQFAKSLASIYQRFLKMFQKKAHLHHYVGCYPEIEVDLNRAVENFTNVIREYQMLEEPLVKKHRPKVI